MLTIYQSLAANDVFCSSIILNEGEYLFLTLFLAQRSAPRIATLTDFFVM